MNTSMNVLRKTAVAACLAVAASASMAAVIVQAAPTTVTPTGAVSLPTQLTTIGGGAFDYVYTFQSQVGNVFANVNAAPAMITSATIFQVSGLSSSAAIGAPTNLSPTPGGNFAITYSTVVGNYYGIEVMGTADRTTTGFISGQVSPVPAPAVLGLVGIGLVGLGLARKARRA